MTVAIKSWDKVALNSGLVLDLALFEGSGLKVHDLAKYHIDTFFTGTPTWAQLASRQQVILLNGLGDYLQCAAADSVDLNFTSEDFSFASWIYGDDPGEADMIMCQSALDVCGWEYYIYWDTLTLALRTNQAGSHTGISAVGALTKDVWQLCGLTRSGTGGQFYINGLPVTTIGGGGLLDPVSAAGAKKLLMGVQAGEIANFFEGKLGRQRAWKSRALTDSEHYTIWTEEHAIYGV